MATIYEVAALAGVSPATVSRVFNDRPVSAAKAALVRAAAETLRFTPNRTARSLRKQNSEVIALVIPDIENPFFTTLARAVEDRAQAAGLSVVLCNSDDDPEKEARYLDIAISENMAGVILAPASDHSDLSAVIARRRPVVAVDRTTGFDIDSVMIDNRPAGRAATDALIAAGFTRIACIAGPLGIVTADERRGGWGDAVQDGAEGAGSELLRFGNYRVDGGRSAMLELLALSDPPDAVVVSNNLMGVGALEVLAEAVRTPGAVAPGFGVAIIGDLPFATFAPAAITVVHLPVRELGTAAADLLIARIAERAAGERAGSDVDAAPGAGTRIPARTVVLAGEIVPARILADG
ncbi:MAG: LacI family DNA-binding transcriptional regulator [Burkholderiaceae bacterium]|nr:LacI family DNA-binding transcriptional regulator [Microbacteriaceae bacterium]